MGNAILYCFNCNTQLRESQFEQGKAYRIDTWVCCQECAPIAIKQLPPERVQLLLGQIHAQEKRAPRPRPAMRDSRPMAAVKPSRAPLIGGIVAGVIGVGVGIAILLSGGSSPKPTPPAALPKPAAKPAAAAETPQRAAFRKAIDFASRNPDDLAGQIREFETVLLMGEATDVATEARQKIAALRTREKEEGDRALAALERDIAELLRTEAFGSALRILESARARRSGAAWTFAVEKRTRDLRGEIGRTFESLREKAKEDKAAERKAEVDAAVARVGRWGIPSYTDEITAALAAVVTFLDIDDCDSIPGTWKYVGGEEFPGAKGSLTIDSTVKHGGTGSFRLQGDFSGGGAYVGTWRDLTGTLGDRDIKEIRVWIKTKTLVNMGIRIADGSGQVHQRAVPLTVPPADQWQEIVLKIPDLVGGDHWGGANDGKWHGPAKAVGLNIGRNSFPTGVTKGEIWLDDIRVIFAPPAR
jgi:hypothetical protein